MMRRLLVAALLTLSAVASAADAEGTARFYGYAFDLESDRYLYTEVHEQVIAGGKWTGGRIGYFAPDGSKLGEKKLDFSADPFIPLYDYQLPALGYREAITQIGSQITLLKTSEGKTRSKSVARKDPITGDSGFHNFLRARFQELMDGKTVSFTFIAAGNLDSYKFCAKRIEDTTFEKKKAVRILVEADSLLRVVAPELRLTYDPEQQRLLEYRGPSNVIDASTGKVYEARIAYYAEPPATAPRKLPPLQ